MDNDNISSIKSQYDQCIAKVNRFNILIKQLSNENEIENLEEIIATQEYMNLLANSLYSINSLTYSYCNLKNTPFPSEFGKVKEYYNKAKNPLAVSDKTAQPATPVLVNKEVAQRIIERLVK